MSKKKLTLNIANFANFANPNPLAGPLQDDAAHGAPAGERATQAQIDALRGTVGNSPGAMAARGGGRKGLMRWRASARSRSARPRRRAAGWTTRTREWRKSSEGCRGATRTVAAAAGAPGHRKTKGSAGTMGANGSVLGFGEAGTGSGAAGTAGARLSRTTRGSGVGAAVVGAGRGGTRT